MIDAALVMLKMSPGLSDFEMEMLLHSQMDGWMPSYMDAAEVDAAVRDAIDKARKSIKSKC